MSKITKSAKGKDCKIRLFPYCDHNPDTTVFCHAPSSTKGMSRKSEDWWGAYGCYTCHGIVDGRIKTDIPDHEIKQRFFEAVHDTQKILFEEGLIIIK